MIIFLSMSLMFCHAIGISQETSKYLSSKKATDLSVSDGKSAIRETDSVIGLIDSIRLNIRQSKDTVEVLEYKFQLAQLNGTLGNDAEAIMLAVQVTNSFETPGPLKFASGKYLRDKYFRLGVYDRAIETHAKLDWEYAPKNWEYYVPDNFVAFAFVRTGDYDKSISILKHVIQVMNERSYIYWEFSFTNSLGVIYLKNNQYDSAWNQFQNANQLLEMNFMEEPNRTTYNFGYLDGLIKGNMAEVLAAKGLHLEAIPLYKYDIDQCSKYPENAEIQSNILYSTLKLAKSYIATNQMSAAQTALNKTRQLLISSPKPEQLLELKRCLWKYYEKLGKQDSALIAVNQYIKIRDSLEQSTFSNTLRNTQISYESQMNIESLAKKEMELSELRSKSEKEKFVSYVIILTATILLASLIFLFRAYRKRLKSELELSSKSKKIGEQAIVITKALEEKDLLLREVHHRVKNNLQIISSLFFLQAKKIKDEQARLIIQEGQSRVHVMSLIHQKLYQAEHLNLINFQEFLSDIAGHIIQSNRRAELHIEMIIEAQNIEQPVDKGLPVGMIVNELITNSIKHAFKGRKTGQIWIRVSQIESYIRIEYEDDGIGIEALDNLENTDSLGMKLIKLLTNQLGGVIEYDVSSGFKLSIEFPV